MAEETQEIQVKKVERELVINAHASEVDIALMEDKILVELHKEKTNNQFAVGDVYLGRVKKILPGLNAAFVDVGYEKEAFLHYLDLGPQFRSLLKFKNMLVSGKEGEVTMERFKLEPDIEKNGKIANMLNAGDLIPVQIAKEPISTKGPRISAEISFAGRYLVLVPFSNRISVSQKIRSSEERSRLKRLIQSIKPANYGVIIRTVAENKKVADLDADLKSLLEKWERCIDEMTKMTAAGRMVSEQEQAMVMLRDLLNESFNNIHVNDELLYEEIRSYIQTIAPQKIDIVKLYKGKESNSTRGKTLFSTLSEFPAKSRDSSAKWSPSETVFTSSLNTPRPCTSSTSTAAIVSIRKTRRKKTPFWSTSKRPRKSPVS